MSDENPHLCREVRIELKKVKVYAGIYGDRVVGPFFLRENFTRGVY